MGKNRGRHKYTGGLKAAGLPLLLCADRTSELSKPCPRVIPRALKCRTYAAAASLLRGLYAPHLRIFLVPGINISSYLDVNLHILVSSYHRTLVFSSWYPSALVSSCGFAIYIFFPYGRIILSSSPCVFVSPVAWLSSRLCILAISVLRLIIINIISLAIRQRAGSMNFHVDQSRHSWKKKPPYTKETYAQGLRYICPLCLLRFILLCLRIVVSSCPRTTLLPSHLRTQTNLTAIPSYLVSSYPYILVVLYPRVLSVPLLSSYLHASVSFYLCILISSCPRILFSCVLILASSAPRILLSSYIFILVYYSPRIFLSLYLLTLDCFYPSIFSPCIFLSLCLFYVSAYFLVISYPCIFVSYYLRYLEHFSPHILLILVPGIFLSPYFIIFLSSSVIIYFSSHLLLLLLILLFFVFSDLLVLAFF